jgi:stress-induced morphogen
MEVQLVGSTNNIKCQEEAKRWVQNHARICYTDKDWNKLLGEDFKAGLIGSLIGRGHHSPLDHFVLNFYLDGPEKALAMVLNNQGMYDTSEKSARYTVMAGVPEHQRGLYKKWDSWFLNEISVQFPEKMFPKLYQKGGDGKTTAEKLAQENARYMTSVFTPTKMTHSLTWRQMNIIYHQFNDFIENNFGGSEEFKVRLANSMKGFVDSDEVKKWVIDEAQVRMKGNIPLRFFNRTLEEHFGASVYSTNYEASFASLAQLHRHRLVSHTISDGFQKGAFRGFYVPRLVEATGKSSEWLEDLESVAGYDFPQAQLLLVGERGYYENLLARTEERECGLAQLETARIIGNLIDNYSKFVPSVAELKKPVCLQGGCKKGGCTFGPSLALERLI